MFRVNLPAVEFWDESAECFVSTEEQTITLCHCLQSIAKWESKWKTPFLTKLKKTSDQMNDYIRCMSDVDLTDPMLMALCSHPTAIEDINTYINTPQTATVVKRKSTGGASVTFSSEMLYVAMSGYGIPWSPADTWHLSRLIAMLDYANYANDPKKEKMSEKELAQYNADLNERNKRLLNTRG